MKTFSINQLEEFTGIRKHTIRIWEKRYSFVQPERTDGKLRFYSLAELQILLDVILLYQSGEKISQLANIDPAHRKEKIRGLNSHAAIEIRTIYQLLIAMHSSDIEQFEKMLDDHIAQFDIHRTLDHILIPFLDRIKLYSYNDQSSEVHFVVTAIRKKIISGIEQLATPGNTDKSVLLFLPPEEHFDLILLYLAYILKKSGIGVWYLGTNISIENLLAVFSIKQPAFLLTYLGPRQEIDVEYYYYYLNQHLQKTQFLIAVSNATTDPRMKIWGEKYFHFSSVLENIQYGHHNEQSISK